MARFKISTNHPFSHLLLECTWRYKWILELTVLCAGDESN